TVYSSTAASTSTTLPNDSNHYILSITNASVSGATFKARRKINAGSYGYRTWSTSPNQDDTLQSWAAPSTLTPTTAPVTAAIFERQLLGTNGEPGCAIFRGKNTYPFAIVDFQYEPSSLTYS